MSATLETPPNGAASFHSCRVRSVLERRPTNLPGDRRRLLTSGYRVERRSRWWPFWRAMPGFYISQSEAITMAQSYLLVSDCLHRAVHEPDVVWKG